MRQLEVRVRVDEAGEKGDLAKLDVAGAVVGRFATAAGRDASIVDRDPSVAHRRLHDRHDPGGVIANQARDDLPVRLRAG